MSIDTVWSVVTLTALVFLLAICLCGILLLTWRARGVVPAEDEEESTPGAGTIGEIKGVAPQPRR